MECFYKRKAPEPNSNATGGSPEDDINWEEEIKYDPGLRKLIDEYHPNQRERVRRKYIDEYHQLSLYINDVQDDDRFSNIQTIVELSKKWWRQGSNAAIIWFIAF